MAILTLAPHRTAAAHPLPRPTVRLAFTRETPDLAALRDAVARLRALPPAARPARIVLEVRAVVGPDEDTARATAARLALIDAVVGVGRHVAAGTVAGTATTAAAAAARLAARAGADDAVLVPIRARHAVGDGGGGHPVVGDRAAG